MKYREWLSIKDSLWDSWNERSPWEIFHWFINISAIRALQNFGTHILHSCSACPRLISDSWIYNGFHQVGVPNWLGGGQCKFKNHLIQHYTTKPCLRDKLFTIFTRISHTTEAKVIWKPTIPSSIVLSTVWLRKKLRNSHSTQNFYTRWNCGVGRPKEPYYSLAPCLVYI